MTSDNKGLIANVDPSLLTGANNKFADDSKVRTLKKGEVALSALLDAFRDTVQRDGIYQRVNQDFSNVSDTWLDSENVMEWEPFRDIVSEQAERNIDLAIPQERLRFAYDLDNGLSLEIDHDEYGGRWVLNKDASTQLLNRLDFSQSLLGGKSAERGPQDDTEAGFYHGLIEHRWSNHLAAPTGKRSKLDTMGQESVSLRLHSGNGGDLGVCRGILSQSYSTIDHIWLVNVLYGLLHSKGVISHFNANRFRNSNGERLDFNILLPDSMRRREDSDYGIMLHCYNGEVGNGGLGAIASVFRSICCNGLIMGAQQRKQVRERHTHVQESDYERIVTELATMIEETTSHTTGLLGVVDDLERMLLPSNVEPEAVLGYAARSLGYQRHERVGIYSSYHVEPQRSALGLVNAITRYAGSSLVGDDATRARLEESAGVWVDDILSNGAWERLTSNAHAWQVASKGGLRAELSTITNAAKDVITTAV